jgi:murein DD-endopeptidase MepM/ murein hydrolase activator NlpD
MGKSWRGVNALKPLVDCVGTICADGEGFVTGRGWLGVLAAVSLVGGAVYGWKRFGSHAPTVDGPSALILGSVSRTIDFEIADAESGLREIRVTVRQGEREGVALERAFAGNWRVGGSDPRKPERVEVVIDPQALELVHGDAALEVVARDWSWRNSFRGNEFRWQVSLQVDLRKPRVEVASGLTYVRRGGSGSVVYSIGEPTVRDGVMVGSKVYRGYPFSTDGASADRRIALFAVPTDAPVNPKIEVFAEDAAGNVGRATWSVVVKERVLPKDDIRLSQRFLEAKVRPLAEAEGISQENLRTAFHHINTELRAANELKIGSIVAESSNVRLWDGAFVQLPNSKVTSRFAEQRTYVMDGQHISQATHFGYDLASTAGAVIEASNSGRVVYADDLGIYGRCVIVDHGQGLFTLYAHLSSVAVSVGDSVEKRGKLGRSGATGLAGGDHLHFAILVGGTYVEPIEWWDPLWVRSHIEARFATSN